MIQAPVQIKFKKSLILKCDTVSKFSGHMYLSKKCEQFSNRHELATKLSPSGMDIIFVVFINVLSFVANLRE